MKIKRNYPPADSLVLSAPGNYVRTTDDGYLHLRFSDGSPFVAPPFGTTSPGKGVTPAEARAFAKEIIRQADAAEYVETKPENWPPKRNDVWQVQHCEICLPELYHFLSGKMMLANGGSFSPDQFLRYYDNERTKLVFRADK